MVMSLKYDQLVQKLLDDGKCVSRSEAKRHASLLELRGGTIEDKIFGKGTVEITQDEIDRITQPKRRGWPRGKKRGPRKVK